MRNTKYLRRDFSRKHDFTSPFNEPTTHFMHAHSRPFHPLLSTISGGRGDAVLGLFCPHSNKDSVDVVDKFAPTETLVGDFLQTTSSNELTVLNQRC